MLCIQEPKLISCFILYYPFRISLGMSFADCILTDIDRLLAKFAKHP
jgi:hypothetical protein